MLNSQPVDHVPAGRVERPSGGRVRQATTEADADLAAEVADLLHVLGRRLRRAGGAELEALGLTGSAARALRLLGRHGEPLRMSELARRLDVVPRSATSFVDALEAAGLAARTGDPDDRRATLVECTPAGRSALSRLRSRRRSAAADLLGRLDPRDQVELRRLLAVLVADDDPPTG